MGLMGNNKAEYSMKKIILSICVLFILGIFASCEKTCTCVNYNDWQDTKTTSESKIKKKENCSKLNSGNPERDMVYTVCN